MHLQKVISKKIYAILKVTDENSRIQIRFQNVTDPQHCSKVCQRAWHPDWIKINKCGLKAGKMSGKIAKIPRRRKKYEIKN
jgi:hypothetical protein